MGKTLASPTSPLQPPTAITTIPEPGPNEILIEVKSQAHNPLEISQQDVGFPPFPPHPTDMAPDVAGIVTKRGASVYGGAPPPGCRVVASGTVVGGYVLAREEDVVALPVDVEFEKVFEWVPGMVQ